MYQWLEMMCSYIDTKWLLTGYYRSDSEWLLTENDRVSVLYSMKYLLTHNHFQVYF